MDCLHASVCITYLLCTRRCRVTNNSSPRYSHSWAITESNSLEKWVPHLHVRISLFGRVQSGPLASTQKVTTSNPLQSPCNYIRSYSVPQHSWLKLNTPDRMRLGVLIKATIQSKWWPWLIYALRSTGIETSTDFR